MGGTWQLITGGLDPDEIAWQGALREMREEAGLELKDPRLVHPGAFVSSGGTSEKIAIVVGIVDTSKAGGIHGNAGEDENIKTVVMAADEFFRRLREGEITDLKTMVAGYWLIENRARLQAPQKSPPPKKMRGP